MKTTFFLLFFKIKTVKVDYRCNSFFIAPSQAGRFITGGWFAQVLLHSFFSLFNYCAMLVTKYSSQDI